MKTTTPKDFTISKNGRYITVSHNHDYEIDLNRIKTERDLLAWTLHLSEKSWMTTAGLHEFISVIAKAKGLSVHGC